MDLSDAKWLNLIKVVSNFKLPEINKIYLNKVPADSEDVRKFMRNSIQKHKHFYFNTNKQFQIEGSKYIDELRIVAKKTIEGLYIDYTNFAPQQFLDIFLLLNQSKS